MAGSALVGGMVFARELWHYWKPRRVGIYGPTLAGKTTLDRYMTTPGEMEDIPEDERTEHSKLLTRYILPRPTRKRVKWEGERRLVHSSDIGGQQRFWNLWMDDAVSRQVEAIVYLFDDRAFKGEAEGLEQIAGFRFLVDNLTQKQYRYRNLKSWWKGRNYTPKVIMLVANKADRFFDNDAAKLWPQGRIGEHKIFDPFRDDLIRLQKAGIPTKRSFMATRIGWNTEATMVELLTS